LVLIDHDRSRARLDAFVDQPLEIPDRPGMARFHSGDGVACLGLVGIDRCGEANPIVGGITERLFLELGEVAEHLDELEADLVGRNQQLLKVAIELRLAPMNCSLRQPRS